MVIHFICRGNAFRSIIAEAYLKSLNLDDVWVISSGTLAKESEPSNRENYQKTLALLDDHHLLKFAKTHYADQLNATRAARADVTVCMNGLVAEEAKKSFDLPANTVVWDVTDVGETGRIAHNDADREKYYEDAFEQIRRNVDQLVAPLSLKPAALVM